MRAHCWCYYNETVAKTALYGAVWFVFCVGSYIPIPKAPSRLKVSEAQFRIDKLRMFHMAYAAIYDSFSRHGMEGAKVCQCELQLPSRALNRPPVTALSCRHAMTGCLAR